MALWLFAIKEKEVVIGEHTRPRITGTGCNEPFKGRYWCPKRRWFLQESCPFVNLQECDEFENACGAV